MEKGLEKLTEAIADYKTLCRTDDGIAGVEYDAKNRIPIIESLVINFTTVFMNNVVMHLRSRLFRLLRTKTVDCKKETNDDDDNSKKKKIDNDKEKRL